MKRKHQKTLELIFKRPISGNIQWGDIESLFLALGTDKGAVASIQKWLEHHGVTP